MRYTFLFFITFTTLTASAQKVVAPSDKTVELTQTDITKLEDFDGKAATVFGIGLRMSMTKVIETVKKQKNLSVQTDPINVSRLYLYAKSDSGRVLLGYLKWHPNDSNLNQIVLYQTITPYLKGGSCTLLSKSCLDPESDVYKGFLGEPADQDVVLDVPAAGLKTVRYYYPAHALMIEVQKNGEETKYNLILYGFKG